MIKLIPIDDFEKYAEYKGIDLDHDEEYEREWKRWSLHQSYRLDEDYLNFLLKEYPDYILVTIWKDCLVLKRKETETC